MVFLHTRIQVHSHFKRVPHRAIAGNEIFRFSVVICNSPAPSITGIDQSVDLAWHILMLGRLRK